MVGERERKHRIAGRIADVKQRPSQQVQECPPKRLRALVNGQGAHEEEPDCLTLGWRGDFFSLFWRDKWPRRRGEGCSRRYQQFGGRVDRARREGATTG